MNGILKKIQDNYQYWDRVKYKAEDCTPNELWNAVKFFRYLRSEKVKFGNYSFNYMRPNPNLKGKFTQTVNLRGSLNLTQNWRINMNTNYDIAAREFSYTSFSVYRDLHCWEMSLNFVPFGRMKSYSFTLNARTSVLKDLKVSKQRSFYDNF